MDLYYDPEKFGLRTVGEIDFSDGCYQFDLTVVWVDAAGRLLYADDSGCSCPSPFEGHGINDLTEASAAEIGEHLKGRVGAGCYHDGPPTETCYECGRQLNEVAALMERVMEVARA